MELFGRSAYLKKTLLLIIFFLSLNTVCQISAASAHTITASVGANGNITPSGKVTAPHGASQTYDIAPFAGYLISDVQVDGASVGAVTTYTFANVTANHTIQASIVTDTSSLIGPFAYITNASDNTVSVIDMSSNGVIGTIPVGNAPYGVAVNAAGTRAYVANQKDNTVSVIDTSSNSVIATVSVGNAPHGVAVNAAGTYAYVANQKDNTISVIDTGSNSVIATVSVGNAPYGVAVNPAGTRVYVTDTGDNTISVIDTSNNSLSTIIAVGGAPYGVAVNAAGTYVYVADQKDNTISVIDTSSNNVIATVSVGNAPYGVAVTPDGTHVYVTDQGGNAVSVIDTGSNSVIATVSVGNAPYGVGVNPAGTYAYVANQKDNTVSVIDTNSNSAVKTVAVGSSPIALGSFIGGPSNYYSIVASAGSNGSISPSGTATVSRGGNLSFTITPDKGFIIYDVEVDGASVGVAGTYTFSDVQANHTITATFAGAKSDIITANAGLGGSINPSGNVPVKQGKDQTFTITANSGYVIGGIMVDSVPVSLTSTTLISYPYTFWHVNGNHAIGASFNPTITSSSGPNGTISPLGTIVVAMGGSQTYTMKPNNGYQVADVQVDGTSVGAVNSYTFNSVTVPHTISVSFAPTYTVTPSVSGGGGTINPSAAQTVVQGSRVSFILKASTGYSIASVTGCGGTLNGNIYTTGPITGNCSVVATFAINTYTVTATSGGNGTITPGSQTINYNGTASFTVAASTGYSIASVTGCGGTLNGNIYTTGPITGDCSVVATFAINTYTVTATSGGNGTITPGSQTVNYNGTASFTVAASTGYSIASVTGCGGTLNGNIYTTGPITANCTVSATFVSPIRIAGTTPVYYDSLQHAYNNAHNGDVIQVQAVGLTGNLNVTNNILVTLNGGYSSDFTTYAGNTTLKGMIQTYSGGGALTIKNFIISQ